MRTYVWTLPTRIFHWLFALSFTIAFILGGEDEFLRIHVAIGCFTGVLILMRIIQGFTGPRYALFRDFPVSAGSIKHFITNMKESKALHPGHNPLAGVVMICMLILALASAVSGMLILASGESGMFGIRISAGAVNELFEEIHDKAVHLLLILVGVHLAGILVDLVFHKANGTFMSMLTGYKKIQAGDAVSGRFQKFFAILWFVLPLITLIYILGYQPMPAGENEKTEQTEGKEHEDD